MAKVAYSADVQEIRGKIGTNVFTRARNGATIRIRSLVRNPKTTAQRASRLYLSKAAAAYEALTPTQAAAWTAYGATITRHDPVTGGSYTLPGINAFTELAAKFLQVTPEGDIPLTPPETSFTGDDITLTAAASAGKVTFTASGPDTILTRVEMLLQHLPSQNRTPSPNGYRSKGFNAFGSSTLTKDVAVAAGWYVPAYRFVSVATGQATEMLTLPAVQVT